MASAKKKGKNPPSRKTPKKPVTNVTPVTQSPEARLNMVGKTLMRNLEATPMNQWQEPIMAALRSAYTLGTAGKMADLNAGADEGEDRALSNSAGMSGPEEIGHDFLMLQAKALGQLARAGLKKEHVGYKLMSFETADGPVVGLMTVIRPDVAQKLKLTN